jgi:hypothetical protein
MPRRPFPSPSSARPRLPPGDYRQQHGFVLVAAERTGGLDEPLEPAEMAQRELRRSDAFCAYAKRVGISRRDSREVTTGAA